MNKKNNRTDNEFFNFDKVIEIEKNKSYQQGARDFAKWIYENVGFDCMKCIRFFNCKEGTCVEIDCMKCIRFFNCKEGTCVENLLEEYEKEQK